MSNTFLTKYFPPSKTSILRAQITNFKQRGGEFLREARDRYQELIRLCLHHGLAKWFILQIFYEGLYQSSKLSIDATVCGSLINKSARDAENLIEEIALNQQQWNEAMLRQHHNAFTKSPLKLKPYKEILSTLALSMFQQ
jgi:Retrotransposon gag protein